ERALETMRMFGFVAVSGVLDRAALDRIRAAMYRAQKAIGSEVGQDRLQRAGELGVLRLLCKYDQAFLELLATPEILAVVPAPVCGGGLDARVPVDPVSSGRAEHGGRRPARDQPPVHAIVGQAADRLRARPRRRPRPGPASPDAAAPRLVHPRGDQPGRLLPT